MFDEIFTAAPTAAHRRASSIDSRSHTHTLSLSLTHTHSLTHMLDANLLFLLINDSFGGFLSDLILPTLSINTGAWVPPTWKKGWIGNGCYFWTENWNSFSFFFGGLYFGIGLFGEPLTLGMGPGAL